MGVYIEGKKFMILVCLSTTLVASQSMWILSLIFSTYSKSNYPCSCSLQVIQNFCYLLESYRGGVLVLAEDFSWKVIAYVTCNLVLLLLQQALIDCYFTSLGCLFFRDYFSGFPFCNEEKIFECREETLMIENIWMQRRNIDN